MPSEIRKDYIHDRYVIIAPKRGERPRDIEKPIGVKTGSEKTCVFCPERVDQQNEIVKTVSTFRKPWDYKVITNKFPSVSRDNPQAYGYQEVIIETPDHFEELENMPVQQVIGLFDLYAERTATITKDKKIDYVLIFKNSGGEAGASLRHAHSQIFATALVPPRLQQKSKKMKAHHTKTGRCIYCDVIKKEMTGPRLVFQTNHMIAFCPWAPTHNYEIWLMPKRHVDNVTLLKTAETQELAEQLQLILKKINRLGLAYNYYFHQIVSDKNQHFYIKIKPRGSVWASVEIGAGFIINAVSPEQAAEFYRQ